MQGFGRDDVMAVHIDPNHHPEAARALDRAKGDLEGAPSVNAAILDPVPRAREDDEAIVHGELGGEYPPELIKTEEDQKKADAHNQDLEIRRERRLKELQQDRENRERTERERVERGENTGDLGNARPGYSGEDSKQTRERNEPGTLDTNRLKNLGSEGAAPANVDDEDGDED